jgi:hypothetical protein
MENPRGQDGYHLTGLGTQATRGSILKALFISDKGKFLIETLYIHERLRRFIGLRETNPVGAP